MKNLALVFSVLLLCSCTTRQSIADEHPEWSPEVKAAVISGNIQIGMTSEQVMASWGSSIKDIRTNQTATTITAVYFFSCDNNHFGGRYCPLGRWAVYMNGATDGPMKGHFIVTSISSY